MGTLCNIQRCFVVKFSNVDKMAHDADTVIPGMRNLKLAARGLYADFLQDIILDNVE